MSSRVVVALLLGLPVLPCLAEPVDPMRPLLLPKAVVEEKASPAPSAALKLELIRLGPGSPLAMINGHLLQPGDAIADATVVAIGRNQVRLRQAGKTLILTLPNLSPKQEDE